MRFGSSILLKIQLKNLDQRLISFVNHKSRRIPTFPFNVFLHESFWIDSLNRTVLGKNRSIKTISETFLNHFICNVNYLPRPQQQPSSSAPPIPFQIRYVFQRLKFSFASILAKLKRFDIGLKVTIFIDFELNRKKWDLVDIV